MKKKVFMMVSVLSIVVMLWAMACASTASAQEFSADIVNHVGKEIMSGKIFVSKDKIRMEMPESIMIIRNDEKISWMVMPAEKMYMEQPINMARTPKVSKEFPGEIQRESLGTEPIDGKPAEKFKVTYTEGKKTESVYQWLRDGMIPVKVEALDGSWGTEYKNISTASQPDSLFEPPADYTKMTMPSMPSLGDLMGQ